MISAIETLAQAILDGRVHLDVWGGDTFNGGPPWQIAIVVEPAPEEDS